MNSIHAMLIKIKRNKEKLANAKNETKVDFKITNEKRNNIMFRH